MKEYKEQADFISENLELIFDNIRKNKNRLFSIGGLSSTEDYKNIGIFSFANWIRPTEELSKITYRIFISTEKD